MAVQIKYIVLLSLNTVVGGSVYLPLFVGRARALEIIDSSEEICAHPRYLECRFIIEYST